MLDGQENSMGLWVCAQASEGPMLPGELRLSSREPGPAQVALLFA